jgi:hypothetical protein
MISPSFLQEGHRAEVETFIYLVFKSTSTARGVCLKITKLAQKLGESY